MAWLKIDVKDILFIDMAEIEAILLIQKLDDKEAPTKDRGKPAIRFSLTDRDIMISIDKDTTIQIDALLGIIELAKCDRARGTLSTKTIIDFEDFLKEKV